MSDDLYFRYMTQGSYRPEEWGHEPKKCKHCVEEKKANEKSKLELEIEKVSKQVKDLSNKLESLKRQYLKETHKKIANS